MKTFSRAICMQSSRLFISPAFYITVLAIFTFLLLGCTTELNTSIWEPSTMSTVYVYTTAVSYGFSQLALSILPMIPFALTFCEDWQSNYSIYVLSRVGKKNYILSLLIVNAMAAFLSAALGQALFVSVISAIRPIVVESDIQDAIANAAVDIPSKCLANGKYYAFFLLNIWRQSMGAIFFASLAFGVSTFFPQKAPSLMIPVIFYYLIGIFLKIIYRLFPNNQNLLKTLVLFLNPPYVYYVTFLSPLSNSVNNSIPYITLYTVVWLLIISFFSYKNLLRRLSNG